MTSSSESTHANQSGSGPNTAPASHTEGDTAHHPGDGLPEVGLRHGIVFHALIMPAALANAQRRWLLLARTPTA